MAILQYTPSLVGAVIFGGLYALLAIGTFYRVFQKKHKWGLCLPIGALCPFGSFSYNGKH